MSGSRESSLILLCLCDESLDHSAFGAADAFCVAATEASTYTTFLLEGSSVFARRPFDSVGSDPNAIVRLLFAVHAEVKEAFAALADAIGL